jgi:hypothetical protein
MQFFLRKYGASVRNDCRKVNFLVNALQLVGTRNTVPFITMLHGLPEAGSTGLAGGFQTEFCNYYAFLTVAGLLPFGFISLMIME